MAESKPKTEVPAMSAPPSAKTIRLFAPGSPAEVGVAALPCRVISVNLREGVFVYQISWWSGAERRTDSVSGCELTAVADSKFWTIEKE